MVTKEILIIDDEVEIAEILADYLLDTYIPVICSEPEAAPALIKKKKFAAIVTDLRMPGLTGLDIVRLVRANYPEVPVIVLTGASTYDADVKAVIEAGASGIIPKPFGTPKQLCEQLAQLMEGRKT